MFYGLQLPRPGHGITKHANYFPFPIFILLEASQLLYILNFTTIKVSQKFHWSPPDNKTYIKIWITHLFIQILFSYTWWNIIKQNITIHNILINVHVTPCLFVDYIRNKTLCIWHNMSSCKTKPNHLHIVTY